MKERRSQRSKGRDLLPPLRRVVFAGALTLACIAVSAQDSKRSRQSLPTLITTRQAHSLSATEAARRYPVHLHAVVTYYDPYIDARHAALFVHDSTGSIFVALPSRPILPLTAGTAVDVTGVSGPGDYAPVVQSAHVRVLGQSEVPPQAPQVTLAQLLSGAEDGQWVEVEGLVHRARLTAGNVILDIATLGGPVTAITRRETGVDYERLVDAVVRVHANAAPVFNRQRQMVGVHLYFPGLSQIKVMEPAPANPFEMPAVQIPDLLRFEPGLQFRHRVHVRGTVTLQWPGQILCIQEASDGLCVPSAQLDRLNVGDRVDVIGFPVASDYKATLENATFRPAGSGRLPMPQTVTVSQALEGNDEGELVRVDGVLLGEDQASRSPTLSLRAESSLFSVILPPGERFLPWKDGSRLRVTGICSVQIDAQGTTLREGAVRTQSVRVLLRSPADIRVLKAPPWWTPARTLLMLAIAAVITVAAFFWIFLLRRQVEQQTLVIRGNEERLRHMAEHDALTNLPNRTLLNDRLKMALQRADRFKSGLTVLMVDLDRFKDVNDLLGHQAGDDLLCQAAERIVALVRKTDTVARIGGDEFVVLLPDLQGPSDAERIAAKVVSAITEPFAVGSRPVLISVSVGVCMYPEGGVAAEDLLQNADAAMYQAKERGRNGFRIFEPETSPNRRL